MITLSQLLESAYMYDGKKVSKLLLEEIIKRIKSDGRLNGGDIMVIEVAEVEEILDEFFR